MSQRLVTRRLVLGLDIGGTSTRALLAADDGTILGTGRGPGGNPTTHGPERAAAALTTALREALRDADPTAVQAATLGLAGGHRLATDPAARTAFDAAWSQAGLRCPYTVVPDFLVGFAAGTSARDGTVLVAGTGAVAADITAGTLGRVADGHGWLLGDTGSGFWLGREAVRNTLSDLDRQAPLGPLSTMVLTELLGSPDVNPNPRETVAALIQRVNAAPPIALAVLTPQIFRLYPSDPAAAKLIRTAADHLISTVHIVRPLGSATPIVLAGGLLGTGPLADEVSLRLARDWPEAPRPPARDGAAAAAWPATQSLPSPTNPTHLHRLLTTASESTSDS